MAPADQLEGIAVAKTLTDWGHAADRSLLAAGVLHDAGKSLAPLGARYRVLMTVLETIGPWAVALAGQRSRAITALAEHASAGARMAEQAGLDPDVVWLIAAHHTNPTDPRMEALQKADALH